MATSESVLDTVPTSDPQKFDSNGVEPAPDLQVLAKVFGLDTNTSNALMIPDMNFLQVRGREHTRRQLPRLNVYRNWQNFPSIGPYSRLAQMCKDGETGSRTH